MFGEPARTLMSVKTSPTIDVWSRPEGFPVPLGATWIASEHAYNFSIYSKNATSVSLLFYREPDFAVPVRRYRLTFPTNKTSRVWHILVPAADIGEARYYAYKIDGPFNPPVGDRFDDSKVLLDPYTRRIFLPPDLSRDAACRPGPNDGKAPLAILPDKTCTNANALLAVQRHTHDMVIYELHVRNFTKHSSCTLDSRTRGTYAGVAAMVPYLKELGVTAVELMPVHQYDPQEGSHWGYMTLGFFAPHHGYAENADPHSASGEFRKMVEDLHAAGIEVILDVVYNHTTEGDPHGPTYSFRGIDNSTYYALRPNDLSQYMNFSACGNDLRTAHALVRKLVIDSLHYWATEMGVDGFRFDLASIFMRDSSGSLNYDHIDESASHSCQVQFERKFRRSNSMLVPCE